MGRPLSRKDYREDLAAINRCFLRVADDKTPEMSTVRKASILECLTKVVNELNQYSIELTLNQEIEDNGEG